MDAIAFRRGEGGLATPFQPRLRLRQGPPPARNPMVLIVNGAIFQLCPHSQRAYCKIGNVVGLIFLVASQPSPFQASMGFVLSYFDLFGIENEVIFRPVLVVEQQYISMTASLCPKPHPILQHRMHAISQEGK